MALLDALRAFLSAPAGLDIDPGTPIDRVVHMGRDEERSLSFEQMWRTGSDTAQVNTIAGVAVSSETAMYAPAVWACVRLISGAIAGLPLHAYRRNGDDRVEITLPEWLRTPVPLNPNITRAVHVQQVVTSMLLDGNAFIYVLPSVGNPTALRVLDPAAVDVKTMGDEVTYQVKGADRVLTPNEIIHIPYVVLPGKARGLNPIDAAKETVGLTIAAQQYTSGFFGNGATLSGVIEFPQGTEPSPEELERLKKDFTKRHVGAKNSYAVGALTGGATWNNGGPNNRDSQLNELMEYMVEECGRLYGVPPHMIGSQKPGAVAYASVEQRNIDFVTHGLQPVIEKIEDGYERVLRGQRTYFKFNVSGLLRGDIKSRWDAYGVALDKKVVKREEVRSWEDLPNIGELGFLETPNNNPPEEPAPAPEPEPEPEPEPARDDELVAAIRALGEVAAKPLPTTIIQNGEEKEPIVIPAPHVSVDTTPMADAVRGLGDLVLASQQSFREELAGLRETMTKPRTKTVIRDRAGKIVGVEER